MFNRAQYKFLQSSLNFIKVSLRFKELDEFDALINDKFSKFFSVRAEYFEVVRKKPIEVFLIYFRDIMLVF